jgi:transcription initiation factor TFIID subunit 10
LVAIASQKFISDLANDVFKHYRKRLSSKQSKSGTSSKDRKITLSMEDLTPVLKDYGIVVRNPPYFL